MNIAIIDDHQILLDGLQQTVAKMVGVNRVDTYISALHFLASYKDNKDFYHLLLTDISMPEMNGTELITNIKELNAQQKILVLSMHKDMQLIQNLLNLNIGGFISKDSNLQELSSAINTVVDGKQYITADIMHSLNAEPNRADVLSSREIQIIHQLSKGLSSKMIAEKLFISDHTVNTHRKNILFKLGLSNTAELIKYAVDHNIS